jgi:hypothetical protein
MEQNKSVELFVPIEKAGEAFNEHLSLPNNNRILFSGKYGSGKTTFLKEFYKRRDNVNVFHLFPVNYQVSENKDIFDLIKFDILTILIEKDFMERDEEIGRSLVLQNYLMTKGANVVLKILENLPKVGKVIKHSGRFADFLLGFNQYFEEINRAKKNSIHRYLNDIKGKEGSLYEFDLISSIIKSSIEKQGEAGKTNVLIIDDLDRMDPAHIFRIMNVFSAHFDQIKQIGQDQSANKFGFDQIIMVCDFDNIRKLFHSFYGIDSDFGGYIDKFFSMRIFEFSLKKEILDKIDETFKYYNDNEPQSGGSAQQLIGYIKPIVSDFIDVSAINLRVINNLRTGGANFRGPYTIPLFEKEGLRNYQLVYVQVIDFLMYMLGNDYERLLKTITSAKQSNAVKMNILKRKHFQHLFPLLLNNVSYIEKDTKHFSDPQLEMEIDYTFNEDGFIDIYYAKFQNDAQLKCLDNINFYTLLEKVLVNMKKNGFFDIV